MGIHFDFGGALTLAPGETFVLPKVEFTASGGDLDDAANQMHRYQREMYFPNPLLIVRHLFNSIPGMHGGDKLNVEELKRSTRCRSLDGRGGLCARCRLVWPWDWSKELGDTSLILRSFPMVLKNSLITSVAKE